jgi:hypothetical protein
LLARYELLTRYERPLVIAHIAPPKRGNAGDDGRPNNQLGADP